MRFTPTAAGSRTGLLTITDNSSTGSTQTVTLSGTGIAVNATATPTPTAFGNQQVNVAATRTITLTNPGNGPLTITNIAVAGTDYSRQGGTCATTVAANGGTCTVIVQFLPTAAAARTGTVTFTDTGIAGGTQVVNLTGTGVNPVIAVAPTSLAFGNNSTGLLGGGGVNRSTTVTNNGPAGSRLIISSTQLTGSTNFTPNSNNCPAAGLTNGASCTISVHFRATPPSGQKTGQLRINHNAGAATILNMTGNAVAGL
jgi:hypothetical protein